MNLLHHEAVSLASSIISWKKENYHSSKIILAPSFIYLNEICNMSVDTEINIAAQNCHGQNGGPFTGEISADMLSSIGVKTVIIGHSEVRKYETDESLYEKMVSCFNNNLDVIFCCGESLDDRNIFIHNKIIKQQIENTILKLPVEYLSKLIIAYEPNWAIGTGINASPFQIEEMITLIHNIISNHFNIKIPILYGGSCNITNIKDIIPLVDGCMVGTSSLDSDKFINIIQMFN